MGQRQKAKEEALDRDARAEYDTVQAQLRHYNNLDTARELHLKKISGLNEMICNKTASGQMATVHSMQQTAKDDVWQERFKK
jgi:hypothetical protein